MGVRELWERMFRKTVQVDDDEARRDVDNVDTGARTTGFHPAQFPPDYVPPVDEGRPRH